MHLVPVCRGLDVLTASVAWRHNGERKIKRLLKKTFVFVENSRCLNLRERCVGTTHWVVDEKEY